VAETVWTRDTLLDVTVNVVPLVVLALFTVLFLVANPWGFSPPVIPAFMLAVLAAAFGSLVVVTYAGARAIARAEQRRSA